MAKLSTDVWLYKAGKRECFVLLINDILKDNPPYVQSGCWCIQSNTNKFHSRNNFYYISGTVRIFQLCYRFILSFVILIAFFIMNTITFYLCLSPSFFSLFHFFYFFHRTDIPTGFLSCLL